MNLRNAITTGLAVLVVAAGLTSCSSSSGTHLMYVSTDQGIFAFRINNKSFRSTAIFTAPFIIGNAPAGMVITPAGNLAYVANQGDNTISLLKIDSVSGTLTEVLPRTQAGFGPNTLVLDDTGSTLFVANQSSNDISAFSVGANGALSLVSTTSVGAQPTNMEFVGGLLFVAVPNFSGVYVFGVNSGKLTQVTGSPFLVPAGVGSVTVDSGTKFLFVTNPAFDSVSAFTIQYSASANTMSLTAAPGSPFVLANASTTVHPEPVAAILDPTTTHLYVTNFNTNNIGEFSVGPGGVLASISNTPPAVGTNPNLILFDSFSKTYLVGNLGSKTISTLTVNSDATLAANSNTTSVPGSPQAIALTK